MRVDQLGRGDPRVAIVGGIHGDEPCGARAIERLLDDPPAVDRPVKCIIANEQALDGGVRYIDCDMNRVFPGTHGSAHHEQQLAYDLLRELEGCVVLSLHSTQSDARPFAIVDTVGPLATGICPQLSVHALLEVTDTIPNALVHHTAVIEVECGLQGSPASTENASTLIREFLTATNVLPTPEPPVSQAVPIYRLRKRLPKRPGGSYAVHVKNFQRVREGTAYATSNDHTVRAPTAFYPVLLSEQGYEDAFGYAADLTGTLGGTYG